jgi:hypothetical protein
MTEKQKNIRSLIWALAVLLTVTTLFMVFYYAIMPLVNLSMIENGTIGAYIYYHQPKTLEEYNEIIAKKNKASLSEVDVSYKIGNGHNIRLDDGGYNLINVYRPEYVARLDGFDDCFIAEYEGYNLDGGNYIVMMCDVLCDDFQMDDVTVCIRPQNAPTCNEFKKTFHLLKRMDLVELVDNCYLKYGSRVEYGWAYWGEFRYMYLLLSDGVAVVNIADAYDCYVERIIPCEDAENVNGVPAKALIDLFNEHERSEG